VVLEVYNYKAGDFKRAKDMFGNLVPLDYSKWDGLCTELGFETTEGFKEGVRQQVRMDAQKKALRTERNEILRG